MRPLVFGSITDRPCSTRPIPCGFGVSRQAQETMDLPDPVNPTIKREITEDAYRADMIQVKPAVRQAAR